MSTPLSDVLIIGGGVAGLTLALEVADHQSVTLVRPAQDDQGASRWAQGGIAAVLSPDDDLDAHINDTLIAGDGLCELAAVRFTVTHGPAAIQWLIDKGVPFTPETDPTARYPYHLTREGGHNARRIIHADDATGRAVVDTLLNKVAHHPNITQRHDLTIVGLWQDAQGACRGAYGSDADQQWHTLMARHTVLATGGASGLYRHTTTPAPSSGEGMMMAAELGACLKNLEFQQLDIRHLGEQAIRHHFPTILAHCAARGIDITQQAIPVVPAAHYSCGGIATDLQGATNVTNLYAIGETACTGLHGANRMASNSLLECLVFARSCAQALLAHLHSLAGDDAKPPALLPIATLPKAVLSDIRQHMRAIMSQHVAIVRSKSGLTAAQEQLQALMHSLEGPRTIRLGAAKVCITPPIGRSSRQSLLPRRLPCKTWLAVARERRDWIVRLLPGRLVTRAMEKLAYFTQVF